MYQGGVTPATSGNHATPLGPYLPPCVGLKVRNGEAIFDISEKLLAAAVILTLILSRRLPPPIPRPTEVSLGPRLEEI